MFKCTTAMTDVMHLVYAIGVPSCKHRSADDHDPGLQVQALSELAKMVIRAI